MFAALLKSDNIAVRDELWIQMTSHIPVYWQLRGDVIPQLIDIDLKIITLIIALVSFLKIRSLT